MDAIICNFKVRYLDPVAICESLHAGPKWMKDDDDYLKHLQQRRTNKSNDINFHKFHQEPLKRVAAYIALMMEQWVDMDIIFVPYYVQ